MVKKLKNPWKRLETKLVYDNPWIYVNEDKVINPSGKESIYGRVSFKNKTAAIIPLDENNDTWLVQQFRYTLDKYSLEIPKGATLEGDKLIDAAKRELKEETGLIANSWQYVMKIHTSISVTNEVGFVFLAQDLTHGEQELDETEDIIVIKLPFKAVFEKALSGEITDSISLAAILKVGSLLPKLLK